MPIKRPQFVNGEIYHIVNRGVEKRIIFSQQIDYFRFVSGLFEFNNRNAVSIRNRLKERKNRGLTSVTSVDSPRELLVEVIGFCLMPNHFHLVLRQLMEDGISIFMQKLGNGYVGYFNLKYDRVGSLFQGRFKAVHIRNNDQLINTVCYVHTNPVEILEPNWKKKGVKNPKKAIKFLESSYRWSSYPDYIGKKNFPSVTHRDFISQVYDGPNNLKKFVRSWVCYKSELNKGLDGLRDLILE